MEKRSDVSILNLPLFLTRAMVKEFFPGLISPGTLANLNSEGKGPRYAKVGKKVVYRTKDLLEWLEEKGLKFEEK